MQAKPPNFGTFSKIYLGTIWCRTSISLEFDVTMATKGHLGDQEIHPLAIIAVSIDCQKQTNQQKQTDIENLHNSKTRTQATNQLGPGCSKGG